MTPSFTGPSFTDLGVPLRLASALAEAEITAPFPIQAATIPDALAGRDLCGRAPTGSGKTLAFGLPLLVMGKKAEPKAPRALILVPTRELALQVQEALLPLARLEQRWVLAVYGGAGMNAQINALRRGVDILVATPGRLIDLIDQRALTLGKVERVVVDEADRMADMGFLPQVRKLLDQVPSTRQTMLFSATLDGDVDAIIREYQNNPIRHDLGGRDELQPDSQHLFWKVSPTERVNVAARLINVSGATVVFTRTRHGADRVAKQLATSGVTAAAIHGGRSQKQREASLEAFRAGRVQALVATDVAARGIHVDGVELVMHWDVPAESKDYIHRSGRTARAGAVGVVASLVVPEQERAVRTLIKALKLDTVVTGPDRALLAIPAATPARPVAPSAPVERERPRRNGAPRDARPPSRSPRASGPEVFEGRSSRPAARGRAAHLASKGRPGASARPR